ncbi:hypothetical protein C9374_013318 [Naegleria lovaniensis]|uniref:Uncharacterized protein n=1 Tax=Naegleria lovaniensis TaxID=51637 RepID=A0AA88GVJ6_NAELO|nr:uncharacterized protein C9374_013318 [Naegleria lovaniensis]KAG2391833.1 hypothetical protein C9374_013318 [Naegleria lovaniensis]
MFLIRRYSELLIEHPVKTKSISCGIITCLGDAITQNMIAKSSKNNSHHDNTTQQHSLVRSLKMFAYGTIVLGPILHNWFRIMEHAFPLQATMNAQERARTVVKRVVTEAFSYSPAIISTFYLVNTTVDYYMPDSKTPSYMDDFRKNGESLWQVLKFKFQKDFLATYDVSLKLWPFAQAINYYLIPPIYRVLFVNTIALGWNAFLCKRQQQ